MTAALLLAAALASAQDAVDARVTAVEGEVTIYAGGVGDGSPAQADTPLEEGDRLVTGEGGRAEIALDGDSLISISPKSDFAFTNAKKSAVTLTLSFGELLAKIRALAAGESLQVRSPAAVAAVRGTEFAVAVDGDDSHVGVFDEGKVEVTGGEGPPELVSANQETSVRKGLAPQKARKLKRLAARRAFMRAHMRGRALAVRKAWRALPPERRLELRKRAFERRERLKQRREDRRERRRQGRRGDRR